MRPSRGFTLIELMIVVALIAVILGIAIPSMVAARKSANEASALSGLRSLTSVCQMYRTRYRHFPPNLSTLRDAGFIDQTFGSGQKSGYRFTCFSGDLGCLSGTTHTWQCRTQPQTAGVTGDRWFRTNQNGVIEVATNAGVTWQPLDSH